MIDCKDLWYFAKMERAEDNHFFVLPHSDSDEDYCISINEWSWHHWDFVHASREVLQNWQDVDRMKYSDKAITIKYV